MLSCKACDNNRHVFSFLCLCRIYYWYDEKGKKTKCTAPQYVDFVMSLCQKLVTDEEIFPTKYGECPVQQGWMVFLATLSKQLHPVLTHNT